MGDYARKFQTGKKAANIFSKFIGKPDLKAIVIIAETLEMDDDDFKKLSNDDKYASRVNLRDLTDDEKNYVFLCLWMFRHEEIGISHIDKVALLTGVNRRSIVAFIRDDISKGLVSYKKCKCSRYFASLYGKKDCPICEVVDTENLWGSGLGIDNE